MDMHEYQNYKLGPKEKEDFIKSLWDDENNNFGQLSTPPGQHQNIPVWPTALYPYNYTSQFKLDQFSNGKCITISKSNGNTDISNFLQIFPKQTILNQSMVEPVMLWLNSKKLHDYKWFFMELNFNEIEEINEDNIEYFIFKVNKSSMTKEARKKICFETKLLRNRKQRCENLILSLNSEVTPHELYEYITCIHNILVCPIPNKNCIIGNQHQLQQDIMLIMKKSLHQLYNKISAKRKLFICGLLEMSVNKYLKCTSLISRNLAFTNDQVEETIIFAEMLKNKVHVNTRRSTTLKII